MLKRFLYSKKGLLITSIIFILFIVFALPYFSNLSERMTHTTFSPDTGFFYSTDEFYSSMMIYGQSGRDFYILMRWTFDVIWPLVYFSFFISLMACLSSKKKEHIFTLPIVAVSLDFVENILASINVGIYPNREVFLLKILQIFSILKWIFIILVIIKILYLITRILMNKN